MPCIPHAATDFVVGILGGSRAVVSGATSPRILVVSVVILLINLIITIHEPPSSTWSGL